LTSATAASKTFWLAAELSAIIAAPVNLRCWNGRGRMPTGYAVGQRDERPWGTWEIIAVGPNYAVKRIVVRPGQRVSLQRHAFRAEHWAIVGGLARVTRGSEIVLLSPCGLPGSGSQDMALIARSSALLSCGILLRSYRSHVFRSKPARGRFHVGQVNLIADCRQTETLGGD
jgi:mannose-6-phosphate isomerase